MPNWCYSSISIYHNDEEKLKALYENIQKWSKKEFKPNGFDTYGMSWLGNIAGNSGIAKWNKEKDCFEGLRTRGSLQSLYFNNGHISLSTETAWAPMMKMWILICDKYLPDATILYTAEEPGMCIYETNDPDVIGMYYIDVWEPPEEFENEEPVYEAEEDYTIEFLQRAMKTDESDIEKLLKMADDIEEPWFAIHKWEAVDLSYAE